MTPYEIMLSESQERMLLVVKRGREAEVERIFEKWDLDAVRVGEVTDDGLMRVRGPRRGRRRDPEPRARRRSARLRPPDVAGRDTCEGQRFDLASLRKPRRRRVQALAGVADDRQQALDLPEHTTTWSAPTRIVLAGLGAASSASKERAGARDVARRQRALLLLDPRQGGAARGRRGARNVACAGGAADRRDQLPQLRQPRAAGDHVAVRRGRRAGIGDACRASTPRSPAATSASTTRPTGGDPAHPGDRRGRVIEDASKCAARRSSRPRRRSSCWATRGELGGSVPPRPCTAGAAAAADRPRSKRRATLLVELIRAERLVARRTTARRRLRRRAGGVLLRHRRATGPRLDGVPGGGDRATCVVRRIGVAGRRVDREPPRDAVAWRPHPASAAIGHGGRVPCAPSKPVTVTSACQ